MLVFIHFVLGFAPLSALIAEQTQAQGLDDIVAFVCFSFFAVAVVVHFEKFCEPFFGVHWATENFLLVLPAGLGLCDAGVRKAIIAWICAIDVLFHLILQQGLLRSDVLAKDRKAVLFVAKLIDKTVIRVRPQILWLPQ